MKEIPLTMLRFYRAELACYPCATIVRNAKSNALRSHNNKAGTRPALLNRLMNTTP
jgi:hypothetical protein